jgi:hypothetical protein
MMTETVDQGLPEFADGESVATGEATTPEPEQGEETASGFEERIRVLTHKNRQYEQQISSLAESLRQLSQVKEQQQQQQPAGPPKPEDFSDPDSYLRAAVDYRVNERMAMESQRQQTNLQMQSIAQQWNKQLLEARAKYADFDAVVGPTPLSQAMGMAIQQSPVGGDVAYYLGQNPSEAARIATLDPLSQVREIGKLESTVGEPKRQGSKAPSPLKAVKPQSTSVRDLSKMSMDEFAAYMDEKEAAERKVHRKLL